MSSERSAARVGLLVLGAALALGLALFLLGEQNNLFRDKNEYSVRFATVSGLAEGNPVQLSGVRVGRVARVVLPRDPEEDLLRVFLEVDARFAARIREDSEARIKTLGLLGDKFVEVTSGSAGSGIIPDGGEISAAPMTDVDELIHSGEDVVENIVRISHTLVTLLERIEQGEGVLGQLLTAEETTGRSLPGELFTTFDQIQVALDRLESAESPIGKLLYDERMGRDLEKTVAELNGFLSDVRTGEGLAQALFFDEDLRAGTTHTLERLEQTSIRLERVVGELESGRGLLPRLLHDEAEADRILGELQELLERLNSVSEEVLEGDGTVARLIRDPSLYEAMDDIVVGVHESRLLRWLIRNRQKKGIEVRVEEAVEDGRIPPVPEEGAGR